MRSQGPALVRSVTQVISGLVPNDVHHWCQVIGEDRESHLGGYFGSVLVRNVAPMRAFIVPNGCSIVRDAGAWLVGLHQALLHSFEQMLMLPSWNSPLWPCCALRFKPDLDRPVVQNAVTACRPPLLVKRYGSCSPAGQR